MRWRRPQPRCGRPMKDDRSPPIRRIIGGIPLEMFAPSAAGMQARLPASRAVPWFDVATGGSRIAALRRDSRPRRRPLACIGAACTGVLPRRGARPSFSPSADAGVSAAALARARAPSPRSIWSLGVPDVSQWPGAGGASRLRRVHLPPLPQVSPWAVLFVVVRSRCCWASSRRRSRSRSSRSGRSRAPSRPADIFQLEYAADPQISPDGAWIAYVRRWSDPMTDRRFSNIWLVRRDGTGNRPLTSGKYSEDSPTWSPDGARLAYVSNRGGSAQIWVRWMDRGDALAITNGSQAPSAPSWSPDGTQLAFLQLVPRPALVDRDAAHPAAGGHLVAPAQVHRPPRLPAGPAGRAPHRLRARLRRPGRGRNAAPGDERGLPSWRTGVRRRRRDVDRRRQRVGAGGAPRREPGVELARDRPLRLRRLQRRHASPHRPLRPRPEPRRLPRRAVHRLHRV